MIICGSFILNWLNAGFYFAWLVAAQNHYFYSLIALQPKILTDTMAEDTKNWWQTLPGILTAVAGVITAITGFLLAVNQAGCFHKEGNTTTVVQTPADTVAKSNQSSAVLTTTLPSQADTTTQVAQAGAGEDSTVVTTSPAGNDTDINLLLPDNGGNIAAASSEKWNETIDGLEDWVQLDYGLGQQAVYGFKDGKTATFHSFTMLISEEADYNIKEFELFVGNGSPTGPFTSLGKFTAVNMKLAATPYQVFSFAPVTAKYLKFKLLKDYGWVHPAAHEFQLWGKLNPN